VGKKLLTLRGIGMEYWKKKKEIDIGNRTKRETLRRKERNDGIGARQKKNGDRYRV